LTDLAPAKLFYFQQQGTTGAACSAASQTFVHLAISPASQTFTLGNAPCFTNIRTWQSSIGPLRKAFVRHEGHRENNTH